MQLSRSCNVTKPQLQRNYVCLTMVLFFEFRYHVLQHFDEEVIACLCAS